MNFYNIDYETIGAMHSHKSLLTMILNYALYPWTHPKCNIIASKSTHVSGVMLPLIMISVGSTGIVLPKVDKHILIKTVDKYKVREHLWNQFCMNLLPLRVRSVLVCIN